MSDIVSSYEFLSKVRDLKREKIESEIANSMGMSVIGLRKKISEATAECRNENRSMAKALEEEGILPSDIAERIGTSESVIRFYLKSEGQQ